MKTEDGWILMMLKNKPIVNIVAQDSIAQVNILVKGDSLISRLRYYLKLPINVYSDECVLRICKRKYYLKTLIRFELFCDRLKLRNGYKFKKEIFKNSKGIG